MKQRYFYLDVVRCLACFLVVVMHSMRGGDNANAVLYVALDTLAKPCNALFFMASGALLLPVKTDRSKFLKRRLAKIIIPCLVWTIVANLFDVACGKQSFSEMLAILVNVPFSDKAYGILWFVYVLIGLYILAPILSPWLSSASKSDVRWLLGIWGVTLILIIARNFIRFPDDERQMLYYFGGYGGYFLLGYYLHQYRPRQNTLLLMFMILLSFVVALLLRAPMFLELNRNSFLGYLSIFIALSSYGWFTLIQKSISSNNTGNESEKINSPIRNFVTKVSNLTFGVYLIHILVRDTIWHIPFVISHGCLIELILTILFTFVFSLSVVWLISMLPFANYIIGYKQTSGKSL